MATFRSMVSPTEVTAEMILNFISSYDGGDLDDSVPGGYVRKYDSYIWIDADTSLFMYDDEAIERCRQKLGIEPKADITMRVHNPRDDVSLALAEEVMQAMIDHWGGLRYRDIFGVDE